MVRARLALFALLSGGCAGGASPHTSLTASTAVCRSTRPFCLPAERMARVLAEGRLRVRAAEPIGRGRTDSRRLLVDVAGGPTVRLKWKAAGRSGDGTNRSPRRELASFALQRLLLDERDYVVPPTAIRCLPPSLARDVEGDEEPTPFDGTRCVLGALSYWIEGAADLDGVDGERFHRDPAYRRRIALLDLVTHLIDHRDTKSSNFLVLAGGDPHAFSVDNGMAFSGWRTPYGLFGHGWQDLFVDALPRDAVERLRAVEQPALDQLLTVAQFRVTRRGLLVPAPLEPPFDPDRGVRRRGDQIQLGLTRAEVDGVARRIAHLLARVDDGSIALFDDPPAARR